MCNFKEDLLRIQAIDSIIEWCGHNGMKWRQTAKRLKKKYNEKQKKKKKPKYKTALPLTMPVYSELLENKIVVKHSRLGSKLSNWRPAQHRETMSGIGNLPTTQAW